MQVRLDGSQQQVTSLKEQVTTLTAEIGAAAQALFAQLLARSVNKLQQQKALSWRRQFPAPAAPLRQGSSCTHSPGGAI